MSGKRDNFSQLPSSSELQNILDAESKRDLPPGKAEIHYFDFSPLVILAEYLGVDAHILTTDFSPENVTNQSLFEEAKKFSELVKKKLLDLELDSKALQILNNTYDYLEEEDDLNKSDLIFVFGAKTPLRIEKAIELYREGMSETILMSGRGPFYGDRNIETEAEVYARIAREKGVPDSALIIEDSSITIPDNVRGSLNLLDVRGIQYKSIILVNSPYSQRRGWAHFKKYTPDTVDLVRINSKTGDQYKHDTWYKNPVGIDVVLGEYLKAKAAVSLNTA